MLVLMKLKKSYHNSSLFSLLESNLLALRNSQKKNYNSKREDNKEEDQREDERNVIL
jgi:hypothetical protein